MPTTAGAMGSAVCHVCGSAGADIQFHATPVRRGTCESAGAAPTPAREMPQLTQPGVALAHWVSSADQDVEPVRIATPTRTCATCGRVATANNVRVLAATDARPPALFGVGLCDICESELSSS